MKYKIRYLAILLLLIFVLLFKHKLSVLSIANPRFNLYPNLVATTQINNQVIFESQIIHQPINIPSAHSSSFVVLPQGDLLAFWFAGSKEGRPDVKIWMSRYHDGTWSSPLVVVDPSMIAKANNRYVIKVGNPVVYLDAHGVLHLFVVSVSFGGWSGSALNHMVSLDEGVTWSEPDRIIVSPFFNISTLVRTSPIGLTDGGFYLPVYHEFIRKYPELLRFDALGNFIDITRITSKNRLLQPSLVPIDSQKAVVYLRNSTLGNEPKNIYAIYTSNGGQSWGKPIPTNLLNHDASVVGLNLMDGRYLMVYNQNTRGHLWLAISYDTINWKPIYQLESNNASGAEYSYPDAHLNNSFIDITYTYNRKEIKHVRFNKKWLDKEVFYAFR